MLLFPWQAGSFRWENEGRRFCRGKRMDRIWVLVAWFGKMLENGGTQFRKSKSSLDDCFSLWNVGWKMDFQMFS